MSIRPNLVEDFHVNSSVKFGETVFRNDTYTYAECLELTKHGYKIPDTWLEEAWHREARSKAAQELNKQMAADREQMAKDKEKATLEHRASFDVVLGDKLSELDTAKAGLAAPYEAVQKAKAAYRIAQDVVGAKHHEIKDVVKQFFPEEPARDFDGNPLPNQTYIDLLGSPHIDGQRIER